MSDVAFHHLLLEELVGTGTQQPLSGEQTMKHNSKPRLKAYKPLKTTNDFH